MAIKCKITTIQGITLENAYINIQNPQIIKVKTEIQIPVVRNENSTPPVSEEVITHDEEIIIPVDGEMKIVTTGVNSYTLEGNVCVYVNEESYNAGKIPIEGFSVSCDLNLDENPLAQAYKALKLNGRLENIEDVLI